MKIISHWGQENWKVTRWIIAACHIFLGAAMLFLGILLYQLEWQATQWMYLIPAHLFLLAFVLYPNKRAKKGLFKYTYRRQKTMDLSLVFFACMAIALSTNYFLHQPLEWELRNSNTLLTAYHPNESTVTQKQKRQVFKKQRQQVKAQLKAFKKTLKNKKAGSTKGQMILLTILVVLLAMIAAYALAALACSLSCSGLEALAIIVLLVGAAGIIWGAIALIKRIWGRTERKIKPKKDST